MSARRMVMATVTALAVLTGGWAAAAPPPGKGRPGPQPTFSGGWQSAGCNTAPDDALCSASAAADASSGRLTVSVAAGDPDPTLPARHRAGAASATVAAHRSAETATEWVATVRVEESAGSTTGGKASGWRWLELEVPGLHGHRYTTSAVLGAPGDVQTLSFPAYATSGDAHVTLRGSASNNSVTPAALHAGGTWVGIPLCRPGYGGFPPCSHYVPPVSVPLPRTLGTGRAEQTADVTVLSVELR